MSFFREIGLSLGCIKRPPQSDRLIYIDNRHLINDEPQVIIPQKYPNNRVVSSRYTLWNFLPKNLFEQFRRIANFYFLCVGIIQLIIDTPVSPVTSILPLVFVVSVTALKQGYEDWLRHKADNEVNNKKAYIVQDGKLVQVKSLNIKVGNIVKVEANQGFPCDLVMLSSHDPEGKCYVTTANLDGETNLKTHYCVHDTRRYQTDADFTYLQSYIECQQPVTDLYKFVGRITVHKDGEEIVRPLGPENVLLRGATLKNTPFIYGCAIYTGSDTKLSLNSKHKTNKFSRVERGLNTFLCIFLSLLLAECLLSTILKYVYAYQDDIGILWYIPDFEEEKNTKFLRLLENFLAFMVLYNYIIPISLYVTAEVQKFVGSMFIQWDQEMYDEVTDSPAKSNTSDLNEELGQVEYLFTDKTGTLTENEMQFRQCSINGIKYEEVDGTLCRMGPLDNQRDPVTTFSVEEKEFLTLLALCHTVRVDHPESSLQGASTMYSHTGVDYEYQASSPDEKAFIEACRRFGVVFHGSHDNHLEVTFHGEMERFKLLHTLEFDSYRKMMSVIVQDENGNIYLYCKGAETAILDRVVSGDKAKAKQHVHDYAVLGLRTLVLGKRQISEKEYKDICETLNDARKSMEKREEKVSEVFSMIETDLHLLGATAVEDKLQEDVPKTLEALRDAGIKIWVLTGDKEETAVNISYSAGHFKDGMTELHLTRIQDSLECAEQIQKLIHRCANIDVSHQKFVLIVDGASLAFALTDHVDILRNLCCMCIAVLCCRMSPLQKAEIVKMIKTSKDNPVTAAIGDGANDVSMIQEAHVGLGIMGKEGRQAVRSSDYSFGKFKFLSRMLLIHGHFFYMRLSTLVQYFFYKNIAFITAQLFYGFYSFHSQQPVFDSFILMFYNITFTSLPIFIYSLFEQHIPQGVLLKKPHLYRKIRRNENMSWKNFAIWNLLGLWHVCVFFFGVVFLFGNDVSLWTDGKMMGIWCFGSLVAFVCVLTVNLKLALETRYWCLPMFLGYIISAAGNISMTLVYTSVFWPDALMEKMDYYKIFPTYLSSITVWLFIVLLVVMALTPDVIIKAARTTYQSQKFEKRVHSESTVPLKESLTPYEARKFIHDYNAEDDSPKFIARSLSNTRL